MDLETIAQEYVKLIQRVGRHQNAGPLNAEIYDFYHGPEEYKVHKTGKPMSLDKLTTLAEKYRTEAEKFDPKPGDEEIRRNYLIDQLVSTETLIQILKGEKMPFDEQTRRIFGVVAPKHDDEYYSGIHDDIEKELKTAEKYVDLGEGNVFSKMTKLKEIFYVPKEKLEPATKFVVSESKKRMMTKLSGIAKIPFIKDGLILDVDEFKDNWRGYNRYLGKVEGEYKSQFQLNTKHNHQLAFLVDVGAHEMYPGHHTFHYLQDMNLHHGKGWIEYSIAPLFSPTCLLAEGLATNAAEILFDDVEMPDFLVELAKESGLYELFKEKYKINENNIKDFISVHYKLYKLNSKLESSLVEAARMYFDQEQPEKEVTKYLSETLLKPIDEAKHTFGFIKDWGPYVVNYSVGQEMVKSYLDEKVGPRSGVYPDKALYNQNRWKAYEDLLVNPVMMKNLKI